MLNTELVAVANSLSVVHANILKIKAASGHNTLTVIILFFTIIEKKCEKK